MELLPVDRGGRLDLDAFRESVERDPASVAVVSVMWANNEVGTLQPIEEVVAIARPTASRCTPTPCRPSARCRSTSRRAASTRSPSPGTSSAARTASAHWCCVASCRCTPLLHGGGQERDIRSGTLDMPAIAGFAAAVEHAVKAQPEYAERMAALRDDLVRRVTEIVPEAHLHGDVDRPAARATPTSASPTARATRC